MRKISRSLLHVAMLMIVPLLPLNQVAAGVVMNGTRFVYPQGAEEITVKVSNVGKHAVLVQSWLDDGDAKATPESSRAPFSLTPPISRVDPTKSQTLRISLLEAELPADRESQYWLNVLEVPSVPKSAEGNEENRLELAVRYRLKVLYRPKGLSGSVDDAPGKLVWGITPDRKLSARNDTPYFVALNSLAVLDGDAKVEVELGSVPPFTTVEFKPKGRLPATEPARWSLEFHSISDWGAFDLHSAKLTH